MNMRRYTITYYNHRIDKIPCILWCCKNIGLYTCIVFCLKIKNPLHLIFICMCGFHYDKYASMCTFVYAEECPHHPSSLSENSYRDVPLVPGGVPIILYYMYSKPVSILTHKLQYNVGIILYVDCTKSLFTSTDTDFYV